MSQLVIRTSRRPPLSSSLSPLALAGMMSRHRDLIRGFAARELLERHKGAILGVAWNILNPLLTLVIYTAVFGYIFGTYWGRGDLPRRLDFPLVFFVGHTLFHVFAETANRAPTLVSNRPNLVRKVVFPLEILPVTIVLSSLVYAAIALGICLLVLFIAKGSVPVRALLLPVVLLPLIMLSLGTGWFLAAVGVFLRDVRHIVQVLTQMLMFMTPIFYQANERIPPGLRGLIEANPLTTIVENGRRALLWDEPLQWWRLGAVTVASAVVMQAGYAFFMTMRRGMADVH